MAVKSTRVRAARRGPLRNSVNERSSTSDVPIPELPPLNEFGNYPARETLAVIVARQLIRRRQQAGWTQAELAVKARVRLQTVRRIEGGQGPTVAAVDKIDRALRGAGV